MPEGVSAAAGDGFLPASACASVSVSLFPILMLYRALRTKGVLLLILKSAAGRFLPPRIILPLL